MLPPIAGYPYDPVEHDLGTPIFDQFAAAFVWHVSYGDGLLPTAQIPAISAGPLEGVIVEGTDLATRKTAEIDDRPTPAKMPATIIRPEKRLKSKNKP